MSLPAEIWDTVKKMSSLEARTEDVLRAQDRIEAKLDDMLQRLSRLEVQQEYLRESVKNEIVADLKSEMVRTQILVESRSRLENRRRKPSAGELEDPGTFQESG